MSDPLRIALAGPGTVGAGVIQLLNRNGDMIARRAGRRIDITAVAGRDKTRARAADVSGYAWFDDAAAMARDADADVIVELIGGEDGPALKTVEAALSAGRSVVTANKAMLARHGARLAELAEAHGVTIAYEAAVAGTVPVIKGLREGLAANEIESLHGVLNGTCNYILSEMEATGREFDDILAEAQALGYAETDPAFDIDGVDAAHKLALLAALAFGAKPDMDGVTVKGIRGISPEDMRHAGELGYRIKLLGGAALTEGRLEQWVRPVLVPKTSSIAAVSGTTNAVAVEGDFSGSVLFEGAGAGAHPTASAVTADLIDLARGLCPPVFGVASGALRELPRAPAENRRSAFYVRLQVLDKPGVFADIAAALRDHEVSMESVLQKSRAPGAPVSVVMTLHENAESRVHAAFKAVEALEAAVAHPVIFPIEPC
ncbi:MAG: homoserine dehydrogenase [Rhodospirillales bacterium]